ncbi:MAG: isoleucine--tRNA ligase [Erysipelothrix sp.]|nr:isoleucine--tRNA ligase [Erysipelothrix sp.]
MNYKDTLLMPKTDFEMRAGLVKKEPVFLERWANNDYYAKFLAKNEGKPSFVLHDGPPYANGDLHSGTAMNRILKDFVVRSKAMAGYYTPFYPGWDTHGLPIENAIIKTGIDYKKISVVAFREACEAYAYEQIAKQKETMKRMGTVADYNNPYITLTKDYEADQIATFGKMAQAGLIYQGHKPVIWSPASESALAESEVVYNDRTDTAIYVAFDIVEGNDVLEHGKFVIWTTTPWTIPANLGISLNPAFNYAVVETKIGNLILLEDNVDALLAKFELENLGVKKVVKGAQLEYIKAQHPLYEDVQSLVMVGNHVSAEEGTGCVHTAPGHGADDYNIGVKYGLKPYSPVDAQGHLTEEAGDFVAGQYYEKANKTVVNKLDEVGALVLQEKITHSYPYDERMKTPIIYRATVQWFASIDKIREKALAEIANVDWKNEWGEVRLHNMIKDRGDWTISRQRQWGLPIPIIYAEDDTPIFDKEVFDHLETLFREHGSKVWYELSANELLPDGYTHPNSPNNVFTKEKDILDVWFDSGSSFNTLKNRGLGSQADLYLEGSDQYRGWFNSSLILSIATNNQAPYKSVLSHGYVLDRSGDKMSKSVGNVIDPNDVISQNGADVLRMWAASIEFKQDVRFADDVIKQASDAYRKVRNTFRFMLGNVSDFDITKDEVAFNQLNKFDQVMMYKLNELNKKVQADYANFEFQQATIALSLFLNNELSSYYLDIAKDILYIEKADSLRRRQVQTVLWYTLDTLVKLYSPVLVFTTEEINDHFMKHDSIHNTHFNEVADYSSIEALVSELSELEVLRDEVLKALEVKRELKEIGKPLEAHVSFNVSKEQQASLTNFFGNDIHQWLTVSSVSFEGNQAEKIVVTKAVGEVCPRCWNVTASSAEDHLCSRCATVISADHE